MLLNFLVFFLLLQNQSYSTLSKLVPPPLPILPIPTSSQLKWQRRELIMFFHFGVNTFTNSEWGTGKESPSIFNPANLNAKQWVNAAADAGFSLVILTAKHHDGFCLWPSKYTDHSVKHSPWKDGKGDVVKEFAEAAAERGIDMGLYLSPWDRHEKSYGEEVRYNEYYLGQLQELLTSYGNVEEIWFDGAKGKNAKNMTYYFEDWFSRAKELQGRYINIFSDAGPDIRWVGDEGGAAGTTCWSTINRTLVSIGTDKVDYLNTGDAKGVDWVPPECDVSIRKGWFWHADQTPKSLSELLRIYYSSVGRNCVLLLNVPPNTSGLLSNSDIERLKEFHLAVGTIFSSDFAKGSIAKASSQRGGKNGGFSAMNVIDDDENSYWAPGKREGGYWIELTRLNPGKKFNVVRIEEAFWMGQRVKRHVVYADGRVIANGTTVGHKRLHRLKKAMTAKRVKVQVLESKGLPLLSAVGLHFDPFVVASSSYEWGNSNNYNATKANNTVLF